jgi:anti-sigma factor RsiW
MNEHDQQHPDDQVLWQRWRVETGDTGPHEMSGCPSPVDLAAFIDGRAAPEQAARLNDHLAMCASCALALSDVRLLAPEQGQTMTFVPPRVIDAARGLVSDSRAEVITARRLALRLRLGAGWGLAAAASLAICLTGYQLGQASIAQPQIDDAAVLTAMSFGIFDAEEDSSDGLSLLTAPDNSEAVQQ